MKSAYKSFCVVFLFFLPIACAEKEALTTCQRDCLIDLAILYLDALSVGDSSLVPFSDEAVFVENITPVEIGGGSWQSVTSVSSTYQIIIPDQTTQQIGIMTLVQRYDEEGHSHSALLAVRLAIENETIVEAEHLLDEVPPIVDMETLESPRPALLSKISLDKQHSREELRDIGEAYYEALDFSDASLAPFAEDCERQENGMITAAWYLPPTMIDTVDAGGNQAPIVARDCIGQLESRRFAYIDSIDNRRIFAVDPEQGLVMGLSHFRQSMEHGPHLMIAADGTELMWDEQREPYDLPAAHLFKITDNEIHEIEAIGIFVPSNSLTGWE